MRTMTNDTRAQELTQEQQNMVMLAVGGNRAARTAPGEHPAYMLLESITTDHGCTIDRLDTPVYYDTIGDLVNFVEEANALPDWEEICQMDITEEEAEQLGDESLAMKCIAERIESALDEILAADN